MDTHSNEKLPLFVVAGMPRGATTFLYHYLAKHPDIFLPFRKEVNYFCTNYGRGKAWYLSLFADMTDEYIAGDISPPCFLDEQSAERIKAFNKDVKVILVVRDPAEWAVSFYHQFSSFSYNMPSLKEYLESGYTSKIGDQELSVTFNGSWISDRIKQYQDQFGSNVLIYNYSFFKSNPLLVLQQIEKHLNVRPYFTSSNFDNKKINASKRYNIKPLSWLLRRETIISLIGWAFPSTAVRSIRSFFDKISTNLGSEAKKMDGHSQEELDLAMAYLSEESAKISALFKDSPIVLGNHPVLDFR